MMDPPIWYLVLILTLFVSNTLPDGNMDPINDPEYQIPEFLFNCGEEPWIADCKLSDRNFFMLYDEQGFYLEERLDRKGNSVLRSQRRKAEKPSVQEIISGTTSYPSFLLQMEPSGYKAGEAGDYFLITSSGKLLTVDGQDIPELVLKEDTCTMQFEDNSEISSETNETITTSASTTAPTANCDQALWKMWKVDDRFLSVESSYSRGFFIGVQRYQVVLSYINEKMTGIKTSFLTYPMVSLERSAGEHPGEGIGREDYGDVLLHFLDRNGRAHEAYICDYEWGLEDANTICRHLKFEAGIPTYDGRYSSTRNPEYAVSGVQCTDGLTSCKFRTICGNSDPSCLIQQSMKQFKGKGYACNKNSETDVAGVICGNQTVITSLLEEKIKCNRGSIEKDKKSVAQMYQLQKQVKATESKMFENKHWSEYLLPMPMAISLMSTVLLVSSQFDRDVELTKPTSGQWEYLKYDWLQANLLFLANNVKNNFELSNANMGVIKVNSRKVHNNMKLAVAYAFSEDKYDSKTLLPRHLRYIEEDAASSTEKAKEVSIAFRATGKIIEELLEALKNSQSVHGNEAVELENVLKIVKKENESDEKDLIEAKEKKTEYDKNVTESRKEFFTAAKKAFNTQCVEETIECESGCEYEPAKQTGECNIEEEIVCLVYDKTCVEEGSVCLTHEEKCTGHESYSSGFLGLSRSSRCKGYRTVCVQEQKICKKIDNSKCIKSKKICTDPTYTLAGNYCKDKGKHSICAPCSWLKEVEATMKSVTQVQMQLQMDAMGDGPSYGGVAMVIEDTVGYTSILKKDFENYKQWKEEIEKKQREAPEIGNEISEMSTNNVETSEEQGLDSSGLDQDQDLIKNKTKSANMNINIRTKLRLLQKMLVMEFELLKEIKLPIAQKVNGWLLELKTMLAEFIQKRVHYIEDLSEEDQVRIVALDTKGLALLKEAEKLRKQKEIQFKPSTSSDHRLGGLAEKHTDNLIARRTTEKKIESLTNKMRKSLKQILSSEIKGQDLKTTIEYLSKCFSQLNFLQKQWDSLKSFFQKLVDFLKDMKTDINRMKDFYDDIGAISLDQPLSKSFKERLQTKIVESLANNIYVMRIAYFYTKLAEEGLLEKMSMVGGNLRKIKSKTALDRYKKFIEDEAIMTQERIKTEISLEEAKMNEKITNDVSSIKNDLACQLEDRKKLHLETKTTLKAIDKLISAENNENNVEATFKTATDADIDDMTLFDATPLGLDKLTAETEDVDDFLDWD